VTAKAGDFFSTGIFLFLLYIDMAWIGWIRHTVCVLRESVLEDDRGIIGRWITI